MKSQQKSNHTAPEFEYIDSKEKLADLVEALRPIDRVAVDTEGDSLYHYFKKVCLIQITFETRNYLIDPLAEFDTSPLVESLSKRELILHGGEYDLRMLRAEYDFEPHAGLFDTMLAAQLLGRDKLGLADLAKEICGVELPKGDKKSDWSARPLSENQLSYAANDTRFLFPIAEALRKELLSAGRLSWMDETAKAMIAATMIEKPAPDPDYEWRIKGVRRMSRRELALVREIWCFRDKEAQRSDRPPFKIMGNQVIIDLAVMLSNSDPEAFSIKTRLPKHFDSRRKRGLGEAIRSALLLPESELPEHPRPKPSDPPPPEMDLLREANAKEAAKLDLPPSVLAPRAAIEAIARNRATTVEQMIGCSKLLRWQAEIVQPQFKQIIESYSSE